MSSRVRAEEVVQADRQLAAGWRERMAVMGMVCTVPSLPVIDTVRPADVPSCPQNVLDAACGARAREDAVRNHGVS